MEKILVVEDDEKIARVIQLELEYANYKIDIAHTGKSALERLENENFDLILLDVMIPELNGLEVLRRVREQNEDVKIIMLTARDAVMDKVSGLDSGANDYMTKPFEIEELLARIRVHLKEKSTLKVQNEDDNASTYRYLSIYKSRREVYIDKEPINLTQKEYDLLIYFLENKNQVLTREQIIEAVWGYDYYGDTNVIDVYVRYLRKKLDIDTESIITSVRGIGYILKD
ncbi:MULTISPECIES: response regulator transcription factor [Mammaliicoccus]|uniref:response regulator transcription factor n=1 Tax=Mammaliicoccus TaxID=2803850 RepID=UPI00066C0B2F|nr:MULTISPECIES: response regulator transcription factor [Mammaliicoccus]ARB40911.1 DNA-binding response regulator [Mammaliicoccus sciuri]MCD3220248.1 response regulator transcription factor [Mammaliicoccus sciuri]MCD8795780.1 response regulator transcription factor [Mammaliicoccus sciuri]MCE5040646.1 response regulator transcription factor [Mammaliicoccus sciuri]MCE5057644.1 response regulator transcription factor [Mammaliicoccus sciuri]